MELAGNGGRDDEAIADAGLALGIDRFAKRAARHDGRFDIDDRGT
jgi:hypothetical protein